MGTCSDGDAVYENVNLNSHMNLNRNDKIYVNVVET